MIPKRYGMSRKDSCPFCQRQATTLNRQGFPVCQGHRDNMLPDLKCVCGEILDMKKGKFGMFFNCISCGPQSPAKVFEINDVTDKIALPKETEKVVKKRKPVEFTVRSDDPRFF